jgi:hypothetical protein
VKLTSSAEFKNIEAIPPLLHVSSWYSAQPIKYSEKCIPFTCAMKTYEGSGDVTPKFLTSALHGIRRPEYK